MTYNFSYKTETPMPDQDIVRAIEHRGFTVTSVERLHEGSPLTVHIKASAYTRHGDLIYIARYARCIGAEISF